jgi:hypothetical protein
VGDVVEGRRFDIWGATCSLLVIPRPDCLGPVPDTALGLVVALVFAEPGVAGDSVPMRDFLAAVLGVTLPARGPVASSLAGDRFRVSASRLAAEAGELGADPARRGVSGLLAFLKFELNAGVNGFPCLSSGILNPGACRIRGEYVCSTMTSNTVHR